MRKLILMLLVGSVFLINASAEKNPKDALSDEEYYKLRTCKSEQKEQEITHDCRDAYSIRAILKGEQEELERNGQQDSMFRIFSPTSAEIKDK